MGKEQKITKWEFERELLNLPAQCKKVKGLTARKKARELFNKYREIISDSKENMEYYEKKYRRIEKMFSVLKSGVVTYSKGEITGSILLKEIEIVEVSKYDVLFIMKNGLDLDMDKSFEYVKELL